MRVADEVASGLRPAKRKNACFETVCEMTEFRLESDASEFMLE